MRKFNMLKQGANLPVVEEDSLHNTIPRGQKPRRSIMTSGSKQKLPELRLNVDNGKP